MPSNYSIGDQPLIRLIIAVVCLFAISITVFAQDARAPRPPKVLIAFFSHTNNTRIVAEEIHKHVGGDLFRISTKHPYPQNDRQAVDIARNERDR